MDLTQRPRRLRGSETLRRMVRETRISKASLIYPAFVAEGLRERQEIAAMPGQYRHTQDSILRLAEELLEAGVDKMMLFGIPMEKDPQGSQAYCSHGVVQEAMKALKDRFPELYLIGDVCMCEYTSHGHCGILHGQDVDNDETLPYLARIALSQVRAGADMVAPSDMMDGRVAVIRAALDREGYTGTPIMSYAVKYASSFLWSLPGGGGLRPGLWRPAELSNGLPQRPRGPPGGQARCGGGGRYHYGEARYGLWRCDYQGPGGGAGAGGLLQRQRRVHHGEVCGPGRGYGRGKAHLRNGRLGLPGGKQRVFDLFCPGTGPFFGRREAGLIDTLCTAF